MGEPQPFPPGGRRADRPTVAALCSNCGELVGRGYPDCAICAEAIDDLWWADWRDLLAKERIRAGTEEELDLARRVLSAQVGSYSWTCSDWALWLLRCAECGGQLGSGDVGCVACAASDAARWAWDHQAIGTSMTPNEHALRVAVAGLRAPHRHREAATLGWRLALPFLLIGDVPSTSQAQRIRAYILAGRYDELVRAESFDTMACLPDIPWRALS